MSKILKIERNGDVFSMRVELESGHRETWMYVREENSVGTSWIQIDKEQS